MATDDSFLRTRPKSTLLPEFGKARTIEPERAHDDQTPAKKSDPLPQPGDPYRAHARFLNRLQADTPIIYFVLGDYSHEGFRYSDLRRLRWKAASKPGQGPSLLLRFVEAEIIDVEIEGIHLIDVEHWIGLGIMPWVWEKPSGFKVQASNAAVITRITISEAKRRMSGE